MPKIPDDMTPAAIERRAITSAANLVKAKEKAGRPPRTKLRFVKNDQKMPKERKGQKRPAEVEAQDLDDSPKE